MTRSTQTDKGLDFDGVSSQGLGGSNNGKYAGNHHGGKAGGNYGRGPTKAGQTGDQAGPSTASANKNPVQSGARKWEPKSEQNYVGNPDKINIGNPITKGNPR